MSSPFALSFQEALTSEGFLEQIRESGESLVRLDLGQGLSGVTKTALAVSKFIMEHNQLLVELPRGAKVADLMKSNGKLVAQLRGAGGHAGRRLQLAAGGSKVAAGSVATALIIVEAAHMISAHDNAKRIKKIETRTKQLVDFNESELLAELEACFRQAKEICLSAQGELTDHDRHVLTNLGQTLFRIRAQWRYRVRSNLRDIDQVSAAWWTGIFRWKREDSLKQSEQQRSAQANESRELLQLMQFSLMLQLALSEQTGRAETFIKHTLVDEVGQWRELASYVSKRGKEIFTNEVPDDFDEFTTGIQRIADYWSILANPQQPCQTTVAEYAKQISLPVPATRRILNEQYEQGRCERTKEGRQYVYRFPQGLGMN